MVDSNLPTAQNVYYMRVFIERGQRGGGGTWPTFSDWAFSQVFSLGHLARFSVPAPTPTVSAFYAFCHLPCHFLQRQQCECVCDLILGVAAASQIVNLPLAELPQNIPLCSNLHVELALLQLHSYCVLT